MSSNALQIGQSLLNQANTTNSLPGYSDTQFTTYSPWHVVCQCQGAPRSSVVHHFTGAPKNETRRLACGVDLTVSSGKGVKLRAVEASTEIDDVTCVACLRTLARKESK